MTWNHRVIKDKQIDGSTFYAIHEVYYNKNGTLRAHTKEPVAVYGDSIKEMRETLHRMLRALKAPALRPGQFKK